MENKDICLFLQKIPAGNFASKLAFCLLCCDWDTDLILCFQEFSKNIFLIFFNSTLGLLTGYMAE